MASGLWEGENRIQMIGLLSVIILPFGFYFWLTSGYAEIVGGILWLFGIMIYIFGMAYYNVKAPEKHRKAVEGKTFLDMEVWRNKEENHGYFFGVDKLQTITISETDALSIEKDPRYMRIKKTLLIDTERQLLNYEIGRRVEKDWMEKLNDYQTMESAEIKPDTAYDRLQDMEKTHLEDIKAYIQNELEPIKTDITELKSAKSSSITGNDDSTTDSTTGDEKEFAPVELTVSKKNMVDMTPEELNFRLRTLEECQSSMITEELSYDDLVLAMQYRVFQVRRIFQKLFSEDVHIEMIKNYQPEKYFDTNMEFERFVLIMRRPYSEEFTFKEEYGSHEGFPVVVQSAKCSAVVAGWVVHQIPIFLVVHSPLDAHKKIDIVQDGKRLQSVKEQILSRLVLWYKTEYEHSDLAVEEEKNYATQFILRYDDLKQRMEEATYEPIDKEFYENEKIIKVIPSGIKALAGTMTMLFIIFLIVSIILGVMNAGLQSKLDYFNYYG